MYVYTGICFLLDVFKSSKSVQTLKEMEKILHFQPYNYIKTMLSNINHLQIIYGHVHKSLNFAMFHSAYQALTLSL